MSGFVESAILFVVAVALSMWLLTIVSRLDQIIRLLTDLIKAVSILERPVELTTLPNEEQEDEEEAEWPEY